MGDVVHALPAVSDLARSCPGTVIEWVIEEDFAEIPRMHRDVARVIPIGLRRWRNQLHLPSTWKQIRAARRDLREYRYDRILDLQVQDPVIAVFAQVANTAMTGSWTCKDWSRAPSWRAGR